ncbi:stage II sporulation protein M [Agrococcus sp. ARC_14]|uniref:stage II sporulation protein M n=1 Tax=Agrococcus sp. ARC_14 TaxID=2919927 RepID=UPI001F06DA20|nr:stage II sporulation protein M [Agrococcus sp. ARC_14]MCH1884193.1 stage II sporulation protein M [Agrococcus sp. ARC_14]
MRAADVDAPQARLWPAATASAVLALAGFALVIATSAGSAGGLAAANVAAIANGDIDESVLAGDRDAVAIAVRNLGAIAILAGGAATCGLLTVLAVAIVGIGVGWGGAAAVAALGAAETVSRIAPYIVFELTGVALAAVAGLLPAVHALLAAMRRRPSPFRAYTDALGTSLALGGIAAALIVVAALVEAIVIGAHAT